MRIQIKAQKLNIDSPLAATHGFIRTNLGLGLLVERVGPKSGELGSTLKTLASERKIDALNYFAKAIYNCGVVATDFKPANIVWNASTNRIILVDGFGETSILKLRTNFAYLRHRKLNRYFKNLATNINLTRSSKTRKFN